MLQATGNTKLRDFQYCLLLNKIPTNAELFKWKMRNDNLCNFCKEQDSIFHVLLECRFVKRIWNHIEMLYPEYQFNRSTVIINKFHDKANHVYNLIGLILKQYVYRCRCMKNMPSIRGFTTEIKNMHNIEKFIAIRNFKISQHEQKWKPVLKLVSN